MVKISQLGAPRRWLIGLFVLSAMGLGAGCSETPPTVDSGAVEPVDTGSEQETGSEQTSSTAETASADTAASAAAGEITLETVDVEGYQQVLDQHKGKVVFVDFWATWCTPCMENFPHTVHVSRAFPPEQVAVISVSFDDPESKDAALAFLQKQEARFTHLMSEYGAGVESMEKFNIDGGVPHYKIYDREGNLVKSLSPGPELDVTVELLDAEVRKVLEQ